MIDKYAPPTCMPVGDKIKLEMNYLDQIINFFSIFLLTELAVGIRKKI